MAQGNNTLTPTALKPVYLVDALGEYAVMPDGAIVNIGGTTGPNFLVGGKPLMYADGTSTDGSPVINISADFQTIYENSVGEAFIDFSPGKDLVFQAENGKQFRFDADTGLVTITGNLVVQGTTTTVINTSVESDRVHVYSTAGDYIPFLVEPRAGVTAVENLAEIRVTNGGAPVFAISPAGVTTIDNLIVPGTINGINITALQQQLLDHISLTDDTIKHTADQVSVDTTGLDPVQGNTVQEAIASISVAITNLTAANIRAYEHVQQTPQKIWTIVHSQNTRRMQISIWDDVDELIYADTVTITDSNTVIVTYNTAITGRAILMLF